MTVRGLLGANKRVRSVGVGLPGVHSMKWLTLERKVGYECEW
jgi:hypothetical protein